MGMTALGRFSIRIALGVLCLCVIAIAAKSDAHENDPKSRNLEPPIHGQAFHRGEEGGVAGSEYASDGIRLESWLPPNITSPGETNGNDCWGYVSTSGREYALMGHHDGLAVVEITEPSDAKLIAFIPGPVSLWRDVKTYQQFAYIVTEGGGWVQVVDLADIDNGNATLVNTFGEGPEGTHNVVIDETSGLLARVGAGNGLYLYDLAANPIDPPLQSIWPSIYVHDAQIHTYTEGPYAGTTLAFCCGGLNGGFAQTGLYIVDLTNPKKPKEIAALEYPFASYSHQGWLSPDARYFYLDDEFDENTHGLSSGMHVIDVTDPATPTWVSRANNGGSAVSHNLYTRESDIYAANYTSGVRIFDVSDPTQPVERAWFDTYPLNDNPNYSGLWSVYCNFPSGTFIGSDMQRGLFVWTLTEQTPKVEFVNKIAFIEPHGQDIQVRFKSNPGVQLQTNSVQAILLDDTMRAPITIPLKHIKDDLYTFTTPPLECGDVTIRFTARSINDTAFTMPPDAPIETIAAYGWRILLNHTMDEDNQGWTVGWEGDDATTGTWQRSVPTGAGIEPMEDHTPGAGGSCWITEPGDPDDPADSHDLDGTTSLVSATIDFMGHVRPALEAAVYLKPGAPGLDLNALVVEISIDAGTSWMQIEVIGTDTQGWQVRSWLLDDFVSPGLPSRIRFRAADGIITDGLVEAAVDDVKVQALFCEQPIIGDLDGDGVVNARDLGILLASWGAAQPGIPADINGNGTVDSIDLGLLLVEWSGSKS